MKFDIARSVLVEESYRMRKMIIDELDNSEDKKYNVIQEATERYIDCLLAYDKLEEISKELIEFEKGGKKK